MFANIMICKKISVVIPVFNGEDTIQETISSILLQNYANIEILVINDGSTDNTKEITLQNQVKYIEHSVNMGPSAARNTGIQNATGDYIYFIDADDTIEKNIFTTFANYLDNNPEVDIVEGLLRKTQNNIEIQESLFSPCFGTTLIRKECLNKIGPFDIRLFTAEDIDWYVRTWEKGCIKHRINVIALNYTNPNKANVATCIKNRKLMYIFKLQRERMFGKASHPNQSLNEFLGKVEELL